MTKNLFTDLKYIYIVYEKNIYIEHLGSCHIKTVHSGTLAILGGFVST